MASRAGLAAPATDVSLATPHWRSVLAAWQSEIGVGAALLVLIAVCGLLSRNFFSIGNFATLLTQTSVTAIIAVGMTVVMIVGEIDLSVGSTVGLAGSVFAWLVVTQGMAIVPAAILVLLGAACIGGGIGGLRVVWGIPSFITTIGLLSTLRGCAFLLTGGVTIAPLPGGMDALWYGQVLGVPLPILLMVAAVICGAVLLDQTRLGRHIYALGGDPVTASRYGVKIRRIRIGVFVVVQMLAAFGGIMLAARLSSGSASVGEGLELDVIAAVIVGGTRLSGGAGRVVGTLIGVLFVAVLRNGMVLLGVNPIGFMILQGMVIILAVWWSMSRRLADAGGRA